MCVIVNSKCSLKFDMRIKERYTPRYVRKKMMLSARGK